MHLPRQEAIAVLALLFAATLSRIARGSIMQVFRGRQQFALGILIDLCAAVVTLVATIVVGLLGFGALVLAAAYLASDLIAGWAFTLWMLHKQFPDVRGRPHIPNASELVEIAQHVKWLSPQQGASTAWLQAPPIILGYLGAGGASIVSFIVLRTLVNFIRSLATMLTIGSGAENAAEYHAGRIDAFARNLQIVGYGLAVLTTAAAMGIILFGPSFVTLWTGENDLYSQVIAFSLIASAVLAMPAAPLATHLLMANLPRPTSVALMCQLAVGLPACALLARFHGAGGAAAGLAIGEVIGQAIVLPLLAVTYLQRFSYTQYLVRCVLVMAATGSWLGLVGMGAIALINIATWPGLAGAAVLWLTLGVVPPLFFALPPDRRDAWVQVAWNRASRVLRGSDSVAANATVAECKQKIT